MDEEREQQREVSWQRCTSHMLAIAAFFYVLFDIQDTCVVDVVLPPTTATVLYVCLLGVYFSCSECGLWRRCYGVKLESTRRTGQLLVAIELRGEYGTAFLVNHT